MPSDRKPGILRNLRIKRVALVDMGANYDRKTGDGAHILLHKSADPSDAGHLAAARDRIETPAAPATGGSAVLNAFVAALTKENTVKKSFIAKLLGLAAEPDAVKRAEAAADVLKEFPDNGDEPVHKGDDPMCKCADCVGKRTSKSANEDVAKAIETEVNKRVAEEVTKAIAGVREEEEVRSILKSFAHTSIDMATDVPMYLAVKRSNPAAYDRMIATIKAQDHALAQSAAFTDIGVRKGTGEGSAWAQIEAKADALLEKSGTELTREQAVEKVMERNPALVRQHRKEANAQ